LLNVQHFKQSEDKAGKFTFVFAMYLQEWLYTFEEVRLESRWQLDPEDLEDPVLAICQKKAKCKLLVKTLST